MKLFASLEINAYKSTTCIELEHWQAAAACSIVPSISSKGNLMSWLSMKDAKTPFESILSHRPELLKDYRAFCQSIWDHGLVSHRTLELCRLRIAAIHGCRQEWVIRNGQIRLLESELSALECGDFSQFDELERAALIMAERIPYQHHELTDEELELTRTILGNAGCVALLTALAFFDVNCRLKLTLSTPEEPIILNRPPLIDESLA